MENYETERLKELIRLAKLNKVVKTQDEFARLIGAKDGTAISHALKGDGKYKVDTLIAKAELALMKAGIDIGNNDSSQTSYQMLANNLENVSKQSSNCLNVDSETDSNKLIAELRETISRQQEQINRLNREIDGLYERIDELKRASSIAAPHSVTAV